MIRVLTLICEAKGAKMDDDRYFFCYSTNMQMFLKNKGFCYICCAYHAKIMRKFWQFKHNKALQAALVEYREQGNELKRT